MTFNDSTNMANALNDAIEHAEMVFKMGEAWYNLSVQLSSFNHIVAVSAASFRGWSPEERIALVGFMMNSTNKQSITFAFDINLPDRVYLGDINDFLRAGIFLHTIPGQEFPVMTRQHAQMQAPTFSTPLRGAFNSTQDNGHRLNTPALTPATDYKSESDVMAGGHDDSPKGPPKARAVTKAKAKAPAPLKRTHQKPPKGGIPRPPNSWICFRRYYNPLIRKQHPGIDNGTVSKMLSNMWKALGEERKAPWREAARQAKIEHSLLYPEYEYQPRRPNEIKRRKQPAKRASTLIPVGKAHMLKPIDNVAPVPAPGQCNALDLRPIGDALHSIVENENGCHGYNADKNVVNAPTPLDSEIIRSRA